MGYVHTGTYELQRMIAGKVKEGHQSCFGTTLPVVDRLKSKKNVA